MKAFFLVWKMEFPAPKQGGYVWVIIKIQPPITKAYSYLLPSTLRLLPYILPTYYLLPSYSTPTTIYQLTTNSTICLQQIFLRFILAPAKPVWRRFYIKLFSIAILQMSLLSKQEIWPDIYCVIMKRHPRTRNSSYITITSPSCVQSHTQDILRLLRISWLTRKISQFHIGQIQDESSVYNWNYVLRTRPQCSEVCTYLLLPAISPTPTALKYCWSNNSLSSYLCGVCGDLSDF